MRPRHAVLLTPLECADPICLPIGIINMPVTPLESALASPSQITENTATLSLVESALTSFPLVNSLECALTKNTGGEVPTLRLSIRRALCSIFSLFAPRAFHNSFLFRRIRTLSKNSRVTSFKTKILSPFFSALLCVLCVSALSFSSPPHKPPTPLLPCPPPVQSLRFHPGEK
jgi:hypothetical protein